jgi:CheY-like chemotaxis protein
MVVVDPTRILLIEDDPNDVELIQLALERHNLVNQIDIVTDGEQALNYLFGVGDEPPTRALPRLILLDLKLPRVNGLEVLQAIRSHPRTRELVVVVMTSSAESRDLNDCYALGVNSFIIKPLEFQQFMEVAHQVGFYWMLLNQVPPPD